MKRFDFNYDLTRECDCSIDESPYGKYIEFEEFKKETKDTIAKLNAVICGLNLGEIIQYNKLREIRESLKRSIGE